MIMETECILKNIPDEYRNIQMNTGTIEKMEYWTNTYDERNLKIKKDLNIYLPKDYDHNRMNVKYDILYLMHGGGENQNTLFGGEDQSLELKNILDHMIEDNVISPMIVVTPTFYVEGNEDISFLAKNIYKELIHDILPNVEQKYHTFAKDISEEGLIKAREHRAFGGFSMGAACTWTTFLHGLDYFKFFMPLSGDCWELCDKGGLLMPEDTARLLMNTVKESGYSQQDYYIYCSTGRDDIAYDNMIHQIGEMSQYKDYFTYTPDGMNGNLTFQVTTGATHWWHYVYDYIYHTLPHFFD